MDLALTLPASWYTDPDVYRREREPIFGRSWVLVGDDQQIPEPGNYFTEDVAGWQVFVRRRDDGGLVAFHNVCPHRAGPIVNEGCGHVGNLTCRYHGWAFAADGALLNARDFGATVPPDTALTRVQVASWRGFIFVCIDPDVAPLDEWLGRFPSSLDRIPLESYTFRRRTVRRVACNWKTYADNFLEGYHVPTVHPAMSRDSNANEYVVEMNDDPRWNIHVMPPRGDSVWGIFGWFWPTFAFNVVPGGFAVERWLPRGHRHIDLIFDYYFAPDAADVDSIIDTAEIVADEDAGVCDRVQRNLESGVYDVGVLSPKWEYPLAAFHRLVRDTVEA
jgi:choline monooxygenase